MAYYKCGKIFATQNSNTSIETASGAIANFNTSLAMPVLDCIADFAATQDLHGQSAPYPAGGSAQIWDEEWEVGGYNNSGEKTTNANIIRCKNPITVPNGAKVYIKCGTTGVTFRLVTYDKDGNCLSSQTVQNPNKTYTFDSDVVSIAFNFDTNYGNTYKNDISINYPATDTAYHPYSNICPIVGVDKVNVTRTGKNLCGGSKLLANAQAYLPSGTTNLVNKTFTFTAWATMTQGLSFTTGLKFKENTQYTFIFVISKESGTGTNLRVFYTDGTTDNIGEVSETNTKTTIVYKTNANKTIKSIGKYNSSSRTTLYYDECGVFEGDLSETDFEPYNGTTALINLGGTYYGGSIDAVTGKITLTHKLIIIDGSQTVTVATSNYIKSDACDGFINIDDVYPNVSYVYQEFNYRSNKLAYAAKKNIWQTTGYPNCFVVNNKQFHVNIANDLLGITDYTQETTVTAKAKIQSFLQSNPIEVVYGIEPIVVYASNTAEIPTIVGVNQVFADTGDVEVKYRRISNDL